MNKEDRGRSAHGWSSQARVGSLSRIGKMLKNKEPYKRGSNAPDLCQEHFSCKDR